MELLFAFLLLLLLISVVDSSTLELMQQHLSNFLIHKESETSFLPRTHSGPYNHLEENVSYFVYSPSGGLGNQFIEIQHACRVATFLNRTLLVPMLGAHSNFWFGYEALPLDALIPMDRILDFVYLSRYCRVVPLNMTLSQFAASDSTIVPFFHRQWHHWKARDFVDVKQRVFYFRGPGMYYSWYIPGKASKTMLRYTKYLRMYAQRIVQETFPNGFNAMHIRLGDYADRWPENTRTLERTIASRPIRKVRNATLPMYIATDDIKHPAFDRIKREMDVYMISNLAKALTRNFGQLFPGPFRLDMLGVLDQLICAQAQDFVPVLWSSFSKGIVLIREHPQELFPEMVESQIIESTKGR